MKKEKIRRIVKYLFIIYCMGLVFILFLYGSRVGNQFHLKIFSKEHLEMTNLVPFKTISSLFDRMSNDTLNTSIVATNIWVNLLMFIPMGMALPVLFDRKFNKMWKTILFVIILVIIIEIVQFFTFMGSADIDDLILNTIGGIVGYGIIKIQFIRRLLKLDE